MAYKEVSRVEITEVIRQWQAGRGIREITRSTGLARNTIRKYILTAQSRGWPWYPRDNTIDRSGPQYDSKVHSDGAKLWTGA